MVIYRLREIVERSMTLLYLFWITTVKKQAYSFNGGVANRALELLGKHIGMFVDRNEFIVSHTIKPGLSLEKLEDRHRRLEALEVSIVDSTGVVVEG